MRCRSLLGQPEDFRMLLKDGIRRHVASTDAMANFQFIVSAARRSWATQNSDALVRYARALGASFRYMREPANRDEVVRIIVDTTGSSEDIRAKPFRFTSILTGAWCRNRARSTSKDSTK